MAANLNKRSQQRLKRLVDSLENINKMVAKLRIEDLEDLVRRDAIGVDGYSSGGSSFAVARSGSGPSSSSVERAVIAKMDGKRPRDPVREEVKRIETQIIQSEENLRQIHQSINFLKEGVEKKRKRPTSVPCEVCMVLPIVKTGFCFECYREWVAAGAPDRQRWVSYKRETTSSDNNSLVTKQPPPRRNASNT